MSEYVGKLVDGLSIGKEELDKLIQITGFSDVECIKLLETTGWNTEDAIINIESIVYGTTGAIISKEAIANGIKNAELYNNLANNLSQLNTMRGGTKGFKGYVFEELHATNATINGQTTLVMNNNGIADFKIIGPSGEITYAQAKIGYKTGTIDFSAYEGQTLIVDKGNKALVDKAKEAGLKVVESDVPADDAARLARQMQLESKITGSSKSVAVPKAQAAINIAKEAHQVGLKTAQKGAQFGGGFSVGTNIVDVISGDKDLNEAAATVAVDTAISASVGYATGVAATAIGNTVVGTTISGAVGTAATIVGSTTVGGAAIAAGATTVGAIGGMGTAAVTTAIAGGTAVSGTVAATGAAIGSAVASTSVGGAAIAAGTAAGTAIASTAVGGAAIATGAAVGGAAVAAGAAVTAAAVAAAPIVAVGVAAGAVWGIGKKIFGRR
ncbi:ubiquitin-associated-like domain-containing protein [Clostridium grantii]|uniref:UBA-like domain-containing protein n=1 Tax=Clostridium grantii DSM 8605 TaxID=1121316 RepID=A0A1M5U8C2_9CLOT|nr:ubiquitin-associated-like domain-containing protein [Clostridium grantii]SHH59170.1 UBA-like domain-containing protein [Clostridium grantii DSM 8605]